MPTIPRPLLAALLLLPFFASHLLAAELTVEDFCFEGPIGSPGTTVTKLGPNHFRVKLLRAPEHPEWGQMLRFTLKNAKGNTLRLDNGPAGLRCFGSYSYDGKTWHPVEKTSVTENGKKIPTLLFPEFMEDTVFFGEEIPMSYEDMLGMMEESGRNTRAFPSIPSASRAAGERFGG